MGRALIALHSQFLKCLMEMANVERGQPISISDALKAPQCSSKDKLVADETSKRLESIRTCIQAQVHAQVYDQVPHHSARLLVPREQYVQRTAAEHCFLNQKPFAEVLPHEWPRLLRGSRLSSSRLATTPDDNSDLVATSSMKTIPT